MDNQIFVKINHKASARHVLEASFTRKTSNDTNVYVGGFSTASFGAHTEFAENLFLFGDTWTVSNRAINQLRVQFGTRRNDWIPNDRNPSVYQYTDFGVITCCGSHPSVDQLNQTRRVQVRNDFNLNLRGTTSSSAAIFSSFRGDHDTRYTSTGFYVIWYGAPLYFRQAFGPTHFIFDEEVYGLYAQDDWRLSEHVTLNLGARYEYNTFTPNDPNNMAPRLGFAWDATHDGRTSVRGGVGLYHDLAFTQLVQVAQLGRTAGCLQPNFRPQRSPLSAELGQHHRPADGPRPSLRATSTRSVTISARPELAGLAGLPARDRPRSGVQRGRRVHPRRGSAAPA